MDSDSGEQGVPLPAYNSYSMLRFHFHRSPIILFLYFRSDFLVLGSCALIDLEPVSSRQLYT